MNVVDKAQTKVADKGRGKVEHRIQREAVGKVGGVRKGSQSAGNGCPAHLVMMDASQPDLLAG